MRDTGLYRQLLGLESPWTVTRVELAVKDQQVDVWASHAEGERWPCPECATSLGLYDHAEERARFTTLFERLAIDVLLETDIRGATRILRISWDEAWHIQERAVARGRRAKPVEVPAQLGVDENAAAKGQRYLTLVCNLAQGTVEHTSDDRKQASLDGYFTGLTEAQREGIAGIARDMWAPYVESVRTQVPDGASKIVFDRFHIMGHVGDAVDRVRKAEHRTLRAAGDETLTGTKYLWLYGAERMPEKHQDRFLVLQAMELKTARAWVIKETLRHLWSYQREGWARRPWTRWYFWATHSRLQPVVEAARLIQRHLPNVTTYFTHRITNAVSEGLNSKIQTIKKRAYGFRNREHFKTAIYFHCGGLDLYPVTH